MISRIGRGVSSATRLRTASVVEARNGGRPLHITYSTLPRLNRSARWSIASPWACSGAMYIGVPAMTPLCVRLASSAARARPKSVILTALDAVLQQDVGRLDVAVDQPLAWAAARPSAICRPMRSTSETSSGPIRSSFCCRVSPAMNSMTR